jgi:tetratricopeptide (TPR) repeat protein
MWHDPDNRLQKAVDRYESGDLETARTMLRALDRQGVISPRIDLYLGHCHLHDDLPQAALKRYRACVALRPDEVSAWIGIALCHGRLGHVDRALEVLNHAASLDPGREEVHCHLVHCYALLGRHGRAMAHARLAADLDPTCPHVHRHLALAFLIAGRPADALAAWREVIARDPDHPEADVGMGRCYAALGRRREARRHYLEALRTESAADAHAGLGELAWMESRFEDAVSHYRNAVQRDPDHHEARVRLAETLGEVGRIPEAWATLQPLSAAWEPHTDPRTALGEEILPNPEIGSVAAGLLRSMGRSARGLRLLRRLVARAPRRADAWCRLGAYLLDGRRLAVAIPVLRRAMRLAHGADDAGHIEAPRLLARALGRVGRRREAVSVLARAAWRTPSCAELHLDLTASLLARGRPAAAERALRRGLGRVPRSADLWAAAAELSLESGRPGVARRRLRVALGHDPRHGHALALLVRWLLARHAYARAVNAARAAMRVLPVDHEVVKEHGYALLALGRASEAALVLRRYVLAAPADPEGYRLLGAALAADGDAAGARVQRRLGKAVRAYV